MNSCFNVVSGFKTLVYVHDGKMTWWNMTHKIKPRFMPDVVNIIFPMADATKLVIWQTWEIFHAQIYIQSTKIKFTSVRRKPTIFAKLSPAASKSEESIAAYPVFDYLLIRTWTDQRFAFFAPHNCIFGFVKNDYIVAFFQVFQR